ncbi:hypothetical protein TNCV_4049771 [Trichonephila clavipes]|nr:hypothetical protein TNCV_4049771 [Trichonephila clavipes]
MEFLIEGLTVNSDKYWRTLLSLKQHIHRIRPGRNDFLLHHDNSRPHCSAQAHDFMRKLKLTEFSQPFLQPRFGTIGLLVVPKIETDVDRLTFFNKYRKFRQPCSNGYAANQNISTWTELING